MEEEKISKWSDEDFVEVESDVWNNNPEEIIGESLIGVYLGSDAASKEVSARHYFEVEGKGQVMVWGTAIIDQSLRFVKEGEVVRLTYKGKKEIDNGKRTLHVYKVERLKK